MRCQTTAMTAGVMTWGMKITARKMPAPRTLLYEVRTALSSPRAIGRIEKKRMKYSVCSTAARSAGSLRKPV